jgi:serine/threonine protein kinase
MKDDENTGEPAGTPNWMAPEVIKFAGASSKSDIWSLGCTIVEMMTGKPPYAGMPSFAALYKIVEDDQPPIPKNMILSDDAKEFLVACFQKNPDDRPSAYDLMKFKWMEPYFTQDNTQQTSYLSPPTEEKQLKKSKSDPLIELSDSETLTDNSSVDFKSHDFGDEVTYQLGEKCHGCQVQMKRSTFKRCQGITLDISSPYYIYLY